MQTTDFPAGMCPLPWQQFSVNTDTSVRVCCNTDHAGLVLKEDGSWIHLSDLENISQATNAPTMLDLRSRMMRGERPDFCKKCYRVEDNGGVSMRQIFLRQRGEELKKVLPLTTPDGRAPIRTLMLDMSLSNTCNLKCRMCTPPSSHLLKVEFDELGLPYHKDMTERAHKNWKNEDALLKLLKETLPTVEEILTTGGEPFLQPLHMRLLEAAVASGDSRRITLCYHTNMTTVPQRLVDLWRNFRHVAVHFSIEAFGELNDYIRHGSHWSRIIENFNRVLALRETMSLSCEVHTCFQALGATRLPELLEFLKPFHRQLPAVPHFNWVDYPHEMAASVLPPPLRRVAADNLLSYFAQNESFYRAADQSRTCFEKIELLRSYLQRLNSLPWDEAQWLKFQAVTDSFDRLRHQSVLRLLPEFAPYWRPTDRPTASM